MLPGSVLAMRYELVRPLGRGGMGQVWLAVDRVLGREVAIKTIDVDGTGDATVAERFQREGQAAASLMHEHVVTVFDSGADAGIAFLVMQLLPGPTVADLLRHGEPLPLAQAVTIAEQTAAALAAIHSIGIVHRDIKPANLVFDGSGRLKVVDFGIASVADAPAAQLTTASTILGSAAYMAPEQAEGGRATPATDLYALGCVLTTLVTGAAPFTGEHPLALLQQHVAAPAPRLAARRPEVPAALDELVDRLLAKAPEARGDDAARVRDELAALRAALPVTAAALAIPFEGPPEPVDAEANAALVGATAVDVPRTRRRSAARVVLPAVVLAAIAALAIAVLPGLLQHGGAGEALASQPPAAATASPPPAASAEPAVADGATAAPATASDRAADEPASGEGALAEGSRGAGTPAPSRSAEQPAPTSPSSTEPATPPTESTAPPPEPAPEEPAPVPPDALAGVRAAIAQAIESGGLEGDAGGALGEGLAAIEASLADGRTEEARAALGELQGQVAQLQEAGAVTPDAAAGIQAAIDDAAASLP
ncbi:serine/threonine-protein kinase [Agrococcus jenensis]|uniref:non-specific serine/threonine protein kinase n=2 Tax=Agrococcus jenensis TaxID=46353 RepID=A0A3N2AWK2_9MICO|nr:serine/threonine-protein kinase [Agrococcus jenensis]